MNFKLIKCFLFLTTLGLVMSCGNKTQRQDPDELKDHDLQSPQKPLVSPTTLKVLDCLEEETHFLVNAPENIEDIVVKIGEASIVCHADRGTVKHYILKVEKNYQLNNKEKHEK